MNTDLNRHVGKYYGKYSGEVTDNEDPDKRGSIKVKVPTMFGSQMEVWARPCFPTAHFYVPPVAARVWIEFEAGNPNYPLYVGVWYPTDAVPAEAAIAPPDDRVIKTPSGHTIELMDKEGEEKIVIRHKDNSFIALDKNGSVLVSNKNGSHIFLNAERGDVTITEEHGNTIWMKEDGMAIVNGDGTMIEMKGEAVKVVAHGAVALHAKDVQIASASVSLGKDATMSAVIGENLLTMFDTHTHGSAVGPTTPPVPPSSVLMGTPASPLSLNVKVK